VSPVLATSRAGNFVRALIIIALMTLLFREAYLMWYFHTPAWNSRPAEIRYCGTWYERQYSRDVSKAEARRLADGSLRQVMRSPVFRPIATYRPARACPKYLFAKVSKDGFVVYMVTED
jgi:hypothetical protein